MRTLKSHQISMVTGGISIKEILAASGAVALTGVAVGVMDKLDMEAAKSVNHAVQTMFGTGVVLSLFQMMADHSSAHFDATSDENLIHIHYVE